MNKITKQLENLYSWTKFYQDRGNKEQIRKCQTEKVKDNRTHPCSESTAKAIAEHQLQYKNHFEYAEVDGLVDKIADKLSNHIYDIIFQAVNDEMGKYYTFQDTNYFTEAGLELFEDEWFEFYQENHGKIMHKLLQNL